MVRLVGMPNEGDRKTTGLARYANRVKSATSRNKIGVIYVPFNTKVCGITQTVRDLIIRPVHDLFKSGRNADVTHIVYEFGAIYLPFIFGRSVVTFHHVVTKEEKNKTAWFFIWRVAARMAVVRADKIIAVSSQTRDEILEKYQVPEDKVVAILTPQSEEFRVLPEIRKERWFGCMGTLEERKNHAAAMRVFSGIISDDRHSDFKLFILGKGPLKDELVKYAEELGISDRTEFISGLSSEEMTEFYNRCFLMLNTSGHEGIGMVTLEAQACGTPVLYFREARIPEEVTVAAVPCTDEDDMVIKAAELISDEMQYEDVRRKGIEYVSRLDEDFDSKLTDIYHSICERK